MSKQLLERYCREADQQAFAAFYRQQADRLWRFLRVRGCGEDAAYDLVSETFLRFLQVVCKDLRYPVALLYRIAVNLHIDVRRREQITPIIYDDAAVAQEDLQPAEATADIREYVRVLVKSLPEHEQNLLLFRYWVGLTHREIAAGLGIPEGTVRRQCAETLKILKKKWLEQARE